MLILSEINTDVMILLIVPGGPVGQRDEEPGPGLGSTCRLAPAGRKEGKGGGGGHGAGACVST